MPRAPRTSNEMSAEIIFERALALPHRQKLELHSLLGEWLQEVGEVPSPSDRRADRQKQALAAMEAVAEALVLAEGQAPTTTQFNAACKQLGLGWNVSSVGRAFNGWRNAKDAFEGGRLPEGSRQIRQRRHVSGPRRTRNTHLQDVRDWLASDPGVESIEDYERWRRRRNDQLVGTEERLIGDWNSVRRVFPGVNHEQLIAAAKEDVTDYAAYCREKVEERLAAEHNPVGLVGLADTAALLCVSEYAVRRAAITSADYPNIVVKLANQSFLYLPDVRAYAAGERKPTLAENALSESVMGTTEVATELGLTRDALLSLIARRRDWRTPMPDGQASDIHYWRRESFRRWKEEHPPETRGVQPPAA